MLSELVETRRAPRNAMWCACMARQHYVVSVRGGDMAAAIRWLRIWRRACSHLPQHVIVALEDAWPLPGDIDRRVNVPMPMRVQ